VGDILELTCSKQVGGRLHSLSPPPTARCPVPREGGIDGVSERVTVEVRYSTPHSHSNPPAADALQKAMGGRTACLQHNNNSQGKGME
jgi:hypothetical protein